MLVVYAQGSTALEARVCYSGLAGVMQLTVHATLPHFVFLAVFCPDTRPSPSGTAGSQRDSKPHPKERDH